MTTLTSTVLSATSPRGASTRLATMRGLARGRERKPAHRAGYCRPLNKHRSRPEREQMALRAANPYSAGGATHPDRYLGENHEDRAFRGGDRLSVHGRGIRARPRRPP